jgi:hypothetical protein
MNVLSRTLAAIVRLALVATVGGCASAGPKNPDWARGAWSVRSALGYDDAHLDVKEDSAQYSSADCKGSLVVVETSRDEVLMSYVRDSGITACPEFGTVILRRRSRQPVEYRWYEPYAGSLAGRMQLVR